MHMYNVLGVAGVVNFINRSRGQESLERLWGHQGRCPDYAETQFPQKPEEVRACATACIRGKKVPGKGKSSSEELPVVGVEGAEGKWEGKGKGSAGTSSVGAEL